MVYRGVNVRGLKDAELEARAGGTIGSKLDTTMGLWTCFPSNPGHALAQRPHILGLLSLKDLQLQGFEAPRPQFGSSWRALRSRLDQGRLYIRKCCYSRRSEGPIFEVPGSKNHGACPHWFSGPETLNV